jgi:hypothetical protein
VTNPDGSFARGLTKDDFTVLDNRAPQAITSFSSEAQTISVSVILDTSGSMASALPRVFGAARAFLDRLTAEDRAMVGSLFYVGPPLTTDKARLRPPSTCFPAIPARRFSPPSIARSPRSNPSPTGESSSFTRTERIPIRARFARRPPISFCLASKPRA